LYWTAPPLLLMAFIYWLGNDRASASETRSALSVLLSAWWPDLSADALALINVVIRKLGHFTGYGLLGLMDARCFRGLRGTLPRTGCLTAWGAAVVWAAVDEFHQSFSASRGATVEDVILDAAGAAAGIFCYWLWLSTRPSKN
jgi:VanZ family protein